VNPGQIVLMARCCSCGRWPRHCRHPSGPRSPTAATDKETTTNCEEEILRGWGSLKTYRHMAIHVFAVKFA